LLSTRLFRVWFLTTKSYSTNTIENLRIQRSNQVQQRKLTSKVVIANLKLSTPSFRCTLKADLQFMQQKEYNEASAALVISAQVYA